MANPLSTEIPALKFTPGRREPTLLTLPVQSGQDLIGIKAQSCPAAYVVATDNLNRLAFYEDQVQTRHPKHQAKSLTVHLLNTGNPDDPRIPLIDGQYKSPIQLKRSIRTFLRHALRRNATQIYFIGATPELFDQLRASERKARERSPGTSRDFGHADAIWAKPMSEAELSRRLLELLPDGDDPQELMKYYVGSSVEAQAVRRLIMLAAGCNQTVLILGESGTGKELVATAIHEYSQCRGEIEAINCSTFPADLLESELFGYEPGAFANAIRTKKGLWELAQNGTLFLDEIADLRADHQAKILRALQENKIRRLGGTVEIHVNARIVCASNCDLLAMVRDGTFRADLYYRIRGLMIRTPSLRSHLNDIEDLALSVWSDIAKDSKKALPHPVRKALRQHTWPGNVRELKSVLEVLHNLFKKTDLSVERLQFAASYLGSGMNLTSKEAGEDRMRAYCSACLRHLLQADEVVHACEVAACQLMNPGKAANKKRQREFRATALNRFSELELLTLRSLLFHTEETYAAVCAFKATFQSFCQQLDHEAAPVIEFWRAEGETS